MLGEIIASVFFLLAMLCVFAAVRNPGSDAEARGGNAILLLGAVVFGVLSVLTLSVDVLVRVL